MFDAQRPRLRAVAYRILGSMSEADDAVQDTWLRLERTDPAMIENVEGWLTTVVARICLNMLRDAKRDRTEPLEDFVPEPIVSSAGEGDPEYQVVLADAVGFALQVVISALSPAERVAFVLHDLFAMTFDEIAPLLDRSPAAARQLASRARRRVRDGAPAPDPNLAAQRSVVEAFFAAAGSGDLDALIAVLDPDVIVRSHTRRGADQLRGAATVARAAMTFQRFAPFVHPALVNGAAGAVAIDGGTPFAILAFTVAGTQVITIDVFNDRDLVPRIVRAGSLHPRTGYPG